MKRPIYNIYCDESCHLENDGIPVMVLGALWFPINKKDEIFQRLKEIKQVHGFPQHFGRGCFHPSTPALYVRSNRKSCFYEGKKITFHRTRIRLFSATAVSFQTNFFLQFFKVRFYRLFIIRTSKRKYLAEKFNKLFRSGIEPHY